MEMKKPDFRSYLKCVLKNKEIIKSKNGREYYKQDNKPKLIILIVFCVVSYLPILLNYAELYIRFLVSLGIYIILMLLAYIPLIYLFSKFIEKDDYVKMKKYNE